VSEYDNSNSGALFKNKSKRPEKKDADYRGSAELVCVHCGESTMSWIDSWLNKAKTSGETFMSLRFKAKDEQPTPKAKQAEAPTAPVTTAAQPEFDDQIPF
jgi:hypothetical protein